MGRRSLRITPIACDSLDGMATDQDEEMRRDGWELIKLAHAAINGDPNADVQALAERTLPKYGSNPAGLVGVVAGMGAVMVETYRRSQNLTVEQVFAAVEQAKLPD